MDHPNRAARARRVPGARPTPRRVPRAADETEYDTDHDVDVYEPLEHDTAFDGDDEHAPQHATVKAARNRRR